MSNLTKRTKDRMTYDPKRYDPQKENNECLECGTALQAAGDRSTVGEYCPECEVSVWIK